MSWKKLITFMLRLLSMLRIPPRTPPDAQEAPEEGAGTATPPAADVLPLASSPKKSADATAVETFGPKLSDSSLRSQLSSLLHSASSLSTRSIDLIVVHCTDTRASTDYTLQRLTDDHRRRGFGRYPGYHFYIRRDGTLHLTRPLMMAGCHVKGHNAHSIGVAYEGGHNEPGLKPTYIDNRTPAQRRVLSLLLDELYRHFPDADIVGHHDLNPNKACPCFNVKAPANL